MNSLGLSCMKDSKMAGPIQIAANVNIQDLMDKVDSNSYLTKFVLGTTCFGGFLYLQSMPNFASTKNKMTKPLFSFLGSTVFTFTSWLIWGTTRLLVSDDTLVRGGVTAVISILLLHIGVAYMD